MRDLLHLFRGFFVCVFFWLRNFFVFYTDRYICQTAENQTWKSTSDVAMDFTKGFETLCFCSITSKVVLGKAKLGSS